MEENPLISVVIPVYNAEKYLSDLLSDIVNQTYRMLEIIVINDVEEEISVTKTVQKIGMEETVILVANEDSSDGSILAGDTISIVKNVNGIEIYNYHILEDDEFYNPFE